VEGQTPIPSQVREQVSVPPSVLDYGGRLETGMPVLRRDRRWHAVDMDLRNRWFAPNGQ